MSRVYTSVRVAWSQTTGVRQKAHVRSRAVTSWRTSSRSEMNRNRPAKPSQMAESRLALAAREARGTTWLQPQVRSTHNG